MSFMKEFRQANIDRDKEWNPKNLLSLSFRGNELAGEVGEACNLIKKIDRERIGLVGSRAKTSDLAEELADIMICVDLIAMELDIDMEQSIRQKFNKTSEQRGLSIKL